MTFLFQRDVYKSYDIGYSFKLCAIDCFIHVCYSCAFTKLRIKRFEELCGENVKVGKLTHSLQNLLLK